MGRNLKQTVYTHVDIAQSPTHLANHLVQHGKTSAEDVENCQSSHKGTQNKGHPHQGKGGKPKKISEVGTDDNHCDQVGVATVLQAPSHSDPNTIYISDV